MEMPVEVLERLNSRAKRVADPEVNLEQLKRESETTRKQWWGEIDAAKAEYNSLSYERNKFLESNMALGRLKLVAAAAANNETLSPGHGFKAEEADFLEEFEQYIVYDRLSVEDIRDYVKGAKGDEKGIVQLTQVAAVYGYDKMYKIMEERNIPNDLALAFQRIYQDRIKKIELAAAEIKLSDAFRDFQKTWEAKKNTLLKNLVTPQKAQAMERTYIAQVQSRLKARKDFDPKSIERFSDLAQIYSELKTLKPLPTDGLGRQVKSAAKKAVWDVAKIAITGNPLFFVTMIQNVITGTKGSTEQAMTVIRESLPNGLGMRGIAQTKKFFFFKKPAFTVEARVMSDHKQLYLEGFDTGNMTLAEMTLQIQRILAHGQKLPLVLALAATTGWEDKAREAAKEGRGIPSSISLVLVDLKDGSLHYKQGDKRLEKMLPLFEGWTGEG